LLKNAIPKYNTQHQVSSIFNTNKRNLLDDNDCSGFVTLQVTLHNCGVGFASKINRKLKKNEINRLINDYNCFYTQLIFLISTSSAVFM